MSKGKVHKQYEFGVKASITKTRDSNIIVGAIAFEKKNYDGHILEAVMLQVKKIASWVPKIVLCDRGYRGRNSVGDTKIMLPTSSPSSFLSSYEKLNNENDFASELELRAS